MYTFLSNSNYTLSQGITFPITEVLGIIAYPVNTLDSFIYLSDVIVNRAPSFDAYTVTLQFKDSSGVHVLTCNTKPFSNYTEDIKDYKLDLLDPETFSGCGCMVVTYKFFTWLKRSIYIIKNIKIGALQINPTFIYNTTSNFNNRISINNTKVNTVTLTNAFLKNNAICIEDKQPISVSDTPKYMTALRIIADGNEVLLKGKSIGFTISPPTNNNNISSFCRVHITTNNDNIVFTDQGVSI